MDDLDWTSTSVPELKFMVRIRLDKMRSSYNLLTSMKRGAHGEKCQPRAFMAVPTTSEAEV